MKAWRDTPCAAQNQTSVVGQSSWYSRDIARHQGTEHPIVQKSTLYWVLCSGNCVHYCRGNASNVPSLRCMGMQCNGRGRLSDTMQWGRQTERDMSDGFNLGLGRASLLQDLPLFLFYSKGYLSVYSYVCWIPEWQNKFELSFGEFVEWVFSLPCVVYQPIWR